MSDLINKPIYILGAGGIGTAVAWSLSRKGYSVTLVDKNPIKVTEGLKNGVIIDNHAARWIPLITFTAWNPPKEGIVLLCTKTYDNSKILARLSDNTFLVPIQNGFDPELEQHDHAGECIASFVSECRRDRPVTRISRPGSLYIGQRRAIITPDEHNNLQSLAAALDEAGLFTVEIVKDIRPYKATKLMYNAAISPLAAIAGVDNGELLTDQLANKLFFSMLRENYAILDNAKVPLARIGPFHPHIVSLILSLPALATFFTFFFRSSLRGTYCSMAPDISVGSHRTEIESYNGYLIRLAGDFPCPLNRAVLALVKKVSQEGLQPQREYLHHLTEYLPRGSLH